MIDEQLSKSFWLREMLQSETATRMGRSIVPPPAVLENLRRGVVYTMQPLRDAIGKPFVITSGYRPEWLNGLIGGAKNSDHVDGRAFDFRVVGMSNFDVATYIATHIDAYMIDKVIYEFGDWVHISIPRLAHDPARHAMTAVRRGGKTVYLFGIIKQQEN